MATDTLTLEDIIACAILEAALSDLASSQRCLDALGTLEVDWPHNRALSLSGHRFDPRCNVPRRLAAAPLVATRARALRLPEIDIGAHAWAHASMVGARLRAGTPALPVFGVHAGWCCASAWIAVLFVVVGVPIGVAASILTDWWLGEGIYRGIAQCAAGIVHDATTRRRRVVGLREWTDTFEALLLRDGDSGGDGDELRRFAALRAALRARRGGDAAAAPAELFRFESSGCCEVPRFDAALWRDTFPPRAKLALHVSGGGLRDHNFEVDDLQACRAAFAGLWACCELRDMLDELGGERVARLVQLLPRR